MGRKALGRLIRAHREAQGVGYYALAEKLGKTPSMVNQIENGKTYPSLEFACQLSVALRIDARDIRDAVLRFDDEGSDRV